MPSQKSFSLKTFEFDTAMAQARRPRSMAKQPRPVISGVAFARTVVDERGWKRTKDRLATAPLTARGLAAGKFERNALHIDSGFRFAAEPNDEDFSFMQVEPLLDQAADLLDRALRDRATYDELAAKYVRLKMEIEEYAELDAIHAEEEANGVYDVPAAVSASEQNATAINHKQRTWLSGLIQKGLEEDFSEDQKKKLLHVETWTAYLSGRAPYKPDTAGQWTTYDYIDYKINGQKQSVSGHLWDFSITKWNHSIATTVRNIALNRAIHESDALVAEGRLPGLVAAAKWDALNAGFMRRRTLIARKFQDIKARLVTEPDGALNFGKRLESLRNRFQRDFRDALARLMAAEQGFFHLYGRADPLPKDVDSIDYFDKCLLWTRTSIQWLVRFARREQAIVMPISIRMLVGDEAWAQGKKNGGWQVNLAKTIDQDLAHVRLRGLTVIAISAADALWRVRISVPKKATVKHLSGAIVPIDQSDLPPASTGRATRRDAIRAPDVIGVLALRNASPMGLWEVAVEGSLPAVSRDALDDLQLDLELVFRRLPSKARN